MPDSPWLTRQEAAAYLRLSVRTLERLAQAGGGPPYYVVRPRRVRYHRDEVDAWAQQRLRRHTADDGSSAPRPTRRARGGRRSAAPA